MAQRVIFDSNLFVSYVKFRNIFMMNKSEWEALFLKCYCNVGGGEPSELNLSEDSQKRLNKKICLLNTQCEEIKTTGKEATEDLTKFVKYVKARNIDLLTKSEWQQSFFFFYGAEFCKRNILVLSTDDIYKLGDDLGLMYEQSQSLLKKCYYLETEESKNFEFKEFYNRYLKNLPQIINNSEKEFSIEIPNPIILELYRRLLRKMQIYQDYSFNKSAVRISVSTFMDLMEIKDSNDASLFEKELLKTLQQYLTENDQTEIKSKKTIKGKLSYVLENIVFPVGVNVLSQLISMKIGI